MARSSALLIFLVLLAPAARAGGPRYVAGTSFFNQGLAGTPLNWAGGQIRYYTDQGDLSPVLPQDAANAFVADAWSRWTSVARAALVAARSGALDEDVNGSNVAIGTHGLALPADLSADSPKPIAIVYDEDGTVTEGWLGAGASSPALCSDNSVSGGIDRFDPGGHIAHAIVVINGRCAQSSADLDSLRYHLVRMLGRVLGLDWSQLNDDVAQGVGSPDELAGFPVMHPLGFPYAWGDPRMTGADQLRMDDRAAISRLYPVTASNAAAFAGKTQFAQSTARIHGRVLFANGSGMQGVNVVARLLDSQGQPSASVAASSVSGSLFRGNWGNPISSSTAVEPAMFGSEDATLQGSYDLAGLEIPDGVASASYELTVEPVRAEYTGATSVGPYGLRQVSMSGFAAPVVVTVTRGQDVVQDMQMQGSAEPLDRVLPNDFSHPAALPGGGVWVGGLENITQTQYYAFTLPAGSSGTFELQAVDESGQPSERKLAPVIGTWPQSEAAGTPPSLSAMDFKPGATGLVQLTGISGAVKLGLADLRGDGRTDFRYRARMFHIDSVQPQQISTAGGSVLAIRGGGWNADVSVTIGGTVAAVQSFTPEELRVVAPPHADGSVEVELADPATGARASLAGALRYGAAGSDSIILASGANPQVAVGTEAPNPITVRVTTSTGSPVAGASVRFAALGPSAILEPCGASACTVATNGAGEASVTVLPQSAGTISITATLASGASVQTTVSAIVQSQLAPMPPTWHVAANAIASLPLLARLVQNGVPKAGQSVVFQIVQGQGSLSGSSASTDSNGDARTTLMLGGISSEIRVIGCTPATQCATSGLCSPGTLCGLFRVIPVPASSATLQKIAGDGQLAASGQALAPIVVRVVDNAVPPNPVAGASVMFRVSAFRAEDGPARFLNGEVLSGRYPTPVALESDQVTVISDAQGMAAFTPSFPASWGALAIVAEASLGQVSQGFTLHTSAVKSAAAQTSAVSSPRMASVKPASSVQAFSVPEMAGPASLRLAVPEPAWAGTLMPETQFSPVEGASSSLTIAAVQSDLAIAADGRATVRVKVEDRGFAAAGRTVSFQLQGGGAELSTESAITDVNGEASVSVTAIPPPIFGGTSADIEIRMRACVGAENAVCTTVSLRPPTASSDTNPPTRSPSCTTGGCSAASAPSDLRQGNRASSKARPGAAAP